MKAGLRNLIIGVAVLAGAWLAFGETTWLEISLDTCKPNGFVGVTRSAVQGRGFHDDQLKAISVEMTRNQQALTNVGNMQSRALEIQAKIEQKMQDVYARAPELRPSPEEIQAERLRAAADDLEAVASQKFIVQRLLMRRDKLFACRDKLAAK